MEKLKTKLINYIASLGVRDSTAIETIAHDVLLDEKAKGFEFKSAKFRVLKYFDETRNYNSDLTGKDKLADAYLHDPLGEEQDDLIDVLAYDDTNEKRIAKLTEQRQLIRKLTSDSDELTTAIVKTWLELDNPTFTAVAQLVGSNRKTVQRYIAKLARNFNEAEFGSINDYLTI